jgi:uncharacterized Zn finger protein
MSEGVVQGAVAESVVDMSSAKEQIHCRVCGSDKMRRILRQGYMELNIYPLFGYYPWRCMMCGTHAMLRKRHRRGKRDHAK